MLVSINPSVGGVSTDAQTRFFNFMCALHSVATCAAGGTPTAVNPVNTSGTKNTGYNCITVISNTEAGGWTAGISNNTTAASSYNASGASLIVDLYSSTGKTTYPYYRQTFGNFTYPFSGGSFTSYPQMQYYQGCTVNNPASVVYSGGTAGFTNGVTASVRPTGSWTSQPTYFPLDVSISGDTIYLAVTANYLILVTPLGMAYFGLRSQAGWETSRTDNPPWCAFGFAAGAAHMATNDSHTDYNYAWMAGINESGGQQAPVKAGGQNAYSTVAHMCTGQGYSTAQTYTWTGLSASNIGGIRPLFQLQYPAGSYGQTLGSYNWSPDSPVTDPVTGLTVPPAWPIIYSWATGTSPNIYTCSGQIPGIYKGMSHTANGLTYFANATEYVISGTSYIPVKTGGTAYPDLFLLRKA